MLRIGDALYARLTADFGRRLSDEFAARLRDELPGRTAAWPDAELRERVAADLVTAESYGLTEQDDLWRYVRLRYATDLERQSPHRLALIDAVMQNRELDPARRLAFIEANVVAPLV